jgi:hypothetical protein
MASGLMVSVLDLMSENPERGLARLDVRSSWDGEEAPEPNLRPGRRSDLRRCRCLDLRRPPRSIRRPCATGRPRCRRLRSAWTPPHGGQRWIQVQVWLGHSSIVTTHVYLAH